MKKSMILAALALCAMTASAQSKWSVTPHAGINISDINGSGTPDYYTNAVGFTGGADVEYRIIRLLGVSAGVNYSVQGCKTDETAKVKIKNMADINSHANRCNLQYITVPLMLNLHVWKGLTVKGGMQCNFLLSAKEKGKKYGYINADAMTSDGEITSGDGSDTEYSVYYGTSAPAPTSDGMSNPVAYHKKMDESIKDEMHKFGVSIPIGISYEYKNFVLEARYSFDLTDMFESVPDETGRNSCTSITLGYRFNL